MENEYLKKPNVTRMFKGNIKSVLTAKLFNFFNVSIYKYFIGCILFSMGIDLMQHIEFNKILIRTLIFFIILVFIVLNLLWISSIYIVKKLKLKDMTVSFNSENILVIEDNNPKDMKIKSWNWILIAKETAGKLFLQISKKPGYFLIIDKLKISNDDLLLLKEWLKKYNKL